MIHWEYTWKPNTKQDKYIENCFPFARRAYNYSFCKWFFTRIIFLIIIWHWVCKIQSHLATHQFRVSISWDSSPLKYVGICIRPIQCFSSLPFHLIQMGHLLNFSNILAGRFINTTFLTSRVFHLVWIQITVLQTTFVQSHFSSFHCYTHLFYVFLILYNKF